MAAAFPDYVQTPTAMAAPAEQEEEAYLETFRRMTELASSFPVFPGLRPHLPLYRHPCGWVAFLECMALAMVARDHLVARPSDVLLAGTPKCGNTWLKAIVFATLRRRESDDGAPLLALSRANPHRCVPFLELQLYSRNKMPNLAALPSPRLYATHMPFLMLPESIKTAGSKIIYIRRDAKDVVVSWWHFVNKTLAHEGRPPVSLDLVVEEFCNGRNTFGPYWDHVLSYWQAQRSLPRGQILLLEYEAMIRDPAGHVRRIAEFLGCPFTANEEDHGAVDGIVRLCEFDSLSSFHVNREGTTAVTCGSCDNSAFFRRGCIGDWANHLSPELARRIDDITGQRFEGTGLIE